MGKDKKDKDKKKDKKKDKDKKKGKDKEQPEAEAPAATTNLNDPSKCKEHPTEQLTLFCESCNKCICNICKENGVHKSVTHSCKPIQSMYSQHLSSLTELIDSKLNVKKEKITQQMEKINGLITTARNKRLDIEIETHRDFDGILQRLKDEESRKMSILNVDLSTLRTILNEIEDIIKSTKPDKSDKPDDAAKGNTQSAVRMIEFLSNYTNLFERASILSNKYIKSDYSQIIDCDDFPQEIKCRKEMIFAYNKLLNDHEVKNEFIDYLLSERKRLLNEIEKQNENIAEIETATKLEMKHWMELTDRFVASLDSFKLKCAFCGIPLHQQSVNSFCELNSQSNHDEDESENVNQLNNAKKFNLSTVEEEAGNAQEFGAKGSGLHLFIPFN